MSKISTINLLEAVDNLCDNGMLNGEKIGPNIEEQMDMFSLSYFVHKKTKQTITPHEFNVCDNPNDYRQKTAKFRIKSGEKYTSPVVAAKQAQRKCKADSAIELSSKYQMDSEYVIPLEGDLDGIGKFIQDFPHHFADMV